MEAIIKELNKLREEIQSSKTKKAQLEGRREEQLKQLKSFGVKTIEDGQKKLEILNKELGKLETEIQRLFKILKETYQW